MADISDKTQNISIVNNTETKTVDTITDGSLERLATDAKLVTGSEVIIKARPGLNFAEFLKNAGSEDLNVDGSVTPVTFTAGPPTGKKWFIHTITIAMEDASINFTKFGGRSALTNGVDFKIEEIGLSEITLATVKRNGAFYEFANIVFFESAATDILVAHVQVLINSGTTFELGATDGGLVTAVVNDDLTTLNEFTVLIRGYEVDE